LKLKAGETILIQGGARGGGCELRHPAVENNLGRSRDHDRKRGEPMNICARSVPTRIIDYTCGGFSPGVGERIADAVFDTVGGRCRNKRLVVPVAEGRAARRAGFSLPRDHRRPKGRTRGGWSQPTQAQRRAVTGRILERHCGTPWRWEAVRPPEK